MGGRGAGRGGGGGRGGAAPFDRGTSAYPFGGGERLGRMGSAEFARNDARAAIEFLGDNQGWNAGQLRAGAIRGANGRYSGTVSLKRQYRTPGAVLALRRDLDAEGYTGLRRLPDGSGYSIGER